jgi:kumamolisin
MKSNVELAGSDQAEPEGAEVLRYADANENTTVTVYLRTPSAEAAAYSSPAQLKSLSTSRSALQVERLIRYDAAGPLFQELAARHGLAVRRDLARCCVHLEGSVAQMTHAFGTSLRDYHDGCRRFRARVGPLLVPEEILPWTRAVVGLDDRPAVRRRLTNLASASDSPGMWPTEVAGLYGVPPDIDAAGQCVGIIALGGGYLPSDLVAAAARVDRPVSLVIDYAVDGVTNNFSGGDRADEELTLDLQIISTIVPSARIVVYFAANNVRSLAQAIHQAITDDVNRPQVLSISWGSAEQFWTDSVRDAVHSALADAVRLRVSVVVAAGDFLATGGLTDGAAHVLFPASSPYALACGGTQIALASDGVTRVDETVWNDGLVGSGGGISDVFQVPDYQQNVALPRSINDGGRRRGVPDVAAAAAQIPGYRIVLNGQPLVKDGTSAAAPLWAALIAMANARRGQPTGFIHPFLYGTSSLCRAIVTGNNRSNGVGYDAAPGWNPCTGLGVPNGVDTVDAIAAMP